jgi:ATP-dependent HslUV protease ATP-binding subunit HslU
MSKNNPDSIINHLDQYIVGQQSTLEAVACAVYLKMKLDGLDSEKRKNSRPSNMLLIGSTGIGKTEIARRLADLLDVPFLNFPVTRLSERGYVGGKIDDVVNALISSALRHQKKRISRDKDHLKEAEDRLRKSINIDAFKDVDLSKINILVMEHTCAQMEGIGKAIFEGIAGAVPHSSEFKLLKPDDLIESLTMSMAFKDKSQESINRSVMGLAQRSIVFLDEIDKLCESGDRGMVSRQGVQYELLPFVEGSSYETPKGVLNTDGILFIAAGSFSQSSPDDLIPELIGRLPVRINLSPFTDPEVFVRILKTKYSTIKQQEWILKCDYPEAEFTDDAIVTIAEYAFRMNKVGNDTGARVLDRIVQAVVRHYLLNVKKGGITKELVEDALGADIEKLEKEKNKRVKLGF